MIHDHRGHGKSVRALDDLGYMYGGGADAILKDIEVVNREMHQQLPDLPLILFGHSMGSLAVRAFARDHDDCMDMLIVCGSPSKMGQDLLEKQLPIWKVLCLDQPTRVKLSKPFPLPEM